MIRKAFVLQLKPDCQDEYERRHHPIWPELEQALRDHGVHGYSIFLDAMTDRLFAHVEMESVKPWKDIGLPPIGQKWRQHMRDILITNPDNSPRLR